MTPTEPRDEQKRRMGFRPTEPRGGEGPHSDLFHRLDEILVEESPMHPFGCATWMEATQIAIDMAKEALSRPVVHGWPDREQIAREVRDAVGHFRMNESMAETAADAIIALFPAPPTDGEGE